MFPQYHILIGFIIVSILFFSGISLTPCLIIFLASFLIDIDHYIWYVYKKKDLNLKGAYFYFAKRAREWRLLSVDEKKRYKRPVILLHGIEFFLLLILLSYISHFFYLVFIGIIIHMIVDFLHILYVKEPLYSKGSQIYVYLTNKNKKKYD